MTVCLLINWLSLILSARYSFIWTTATDLLGVRSRPPAPPRWALCRCGLCACAWRVLRSACRFSHSGCSCRVCRVCGPHGVCKGWSILWSASRSQALCTHTVFLLEKQKTWDISRKETRLSFRVWHQKTLAHRCVSSCDSCSWWHWRMTAHNSAQSRSTAAPRCVFGCELCGCWRWWTTCRNLLSGI